MTDPLPTFTVGVGQAGIAMLNTLAETVERNDNGEFFDYFAIDTDGDTLGSVPAGTTRVRLQPSDAHEDEDKATYAYLTEDSEIGGKGAERQRPVGRYKLDSRGTETFDDYFEALWYDILEHYEEVDFAFTEDRDSYNIFLLHSLGGGTGSGTFPLLSAMLNRIAQRIEAQNQNVDVYISAVGVAPQVDFNPEVTDPPGEAMYYPNTYSSLSDLSNMLDADTDPLDIPIYSKSFGQGGELSDVDERVEESFTGNAIPIERAPYNDYWLVGVDENLITSGTGTDFVEGYREQINRRVAESIYALSEMEQSVENWSSRAKGTAALGTVGHAQLQVPHEQVREFCKMKDEREEKQTLVTETIPGKLDDLRSEKDDLEEIKQDPTTVNEHLDDVSDWQQNFRGRFESQLGAGNALVRNSTDEDIKRVLDAIEAEARPDEPEEEEDGEVSEEPEDIDDIRADQRAELLLLATEILEEMLQTPNAAPAVEDHWEELVASQWRTYDMAERTKYGGSATSTLEGKAEALKTFYDEKINEFQEQLDDIDLGAIGQAQEFFPPWNPLMESDREAAEKKLDRLRESRDDLLEADGRYQRVQGMKEAVRSRRNRAKNLLDDKISAVNSLITDRESAKEKAENRIDALERSIEQEKDELASEGTGKRLGIFPLRRDKLDDEDLTLQRVDNELTSLDAYVDQDFIDPRKVRNGINQWLSNATSWEEPVFDLNYSGTDRANTKSIRQEMWLLYHEDNEQYAFDDDNFFGGTTRRSGSDSMIDYINDPYSISFVSFYNRGPVEALTLYQRLRDMADRGQLDPMAGKYRDYRQAFAYPEWYDRETRLAFQIKSRIEIPRPPELDIGRVEKSDMSEGELKNFIKQTGLDTYMWRGTMWEDYDFDDDDDVFEGWDRTLEAITFTSLQQATPDPDLKSRWLAGQADWDDILEAYKKNLEDSEELQITFD